MAGVSDAPAPIPVEALSSASVVVITPEAAPTMSVEDSAVVAQPVQAAAAPARLLNPVRSEATPVPQVFARLRSKQFRRKLGSIGLAGVVVASVCALLAVALAQEPPSWFRAVDVKDQKVIDAARRIENSFTTLVTRVRNSPIPGGANGGGGGGGSTHNDIWTLAVSAEDATAWLNTRLPKWLESQEASTFKWPEEVGTLRIRFESGRIYVAASLHKGGQMQVFSAAVEPQFHADGSLWLPAQWLGVGRLPLPTSMILGRSVDAPPSQVPAQFAKLSQSRDVIATLRGLAPAMPSPVVRIGDGRRVRIIAMDAQDGRLLVTCQTLARDAPKPAAAMIGPPAPNPTDETGAQAKPNTGSGQTGGSAATTVIKDVEPARQN